MPIKVAILGQGRSGRDIHGANLIHLQDKYTIVAVSDPLEERRARAQKEYGCETYEDYRDLLQRKDIDLIVNATPSHQHVPVSEEFLRNGFHVLSEKPAARIPQEVDSLIQTAKQSGKVYAVFQQSRYSPAFRQIRRVIDSGVLGRIVQVSIAYSGFARRWDWQTVHAYNGGNLMNTGPHPVDQALQLFGGEDTEMPNITCIMDRANTYGDAEDYVKLLMHGEGRPVVDVEISSCNAYPCFTYHLQGTRGGLKGSLNHLDWKYYNPDTEPVREQILAPLASSEGTPMYCSEQLTWHEESWDIADEQGRDLFGTMTTDFYNMLYNTLTSGAPLEITPEQVRRQIAVMEECFRQNAKLFNK